MKYCFVTFLLGLAIAGGIGYAFFYDATHISVDEKIDFSKRW